MGHRWVSKTAAPLSLANAVNGTVGGVKSEGLFVFLGVQEFHSFEGLAELLASVTDLLVGWSRCFRDSTDV